MNYSKLLGLLICLICFIAVVTGAIHLFGVRITAVLTCLAAIEIWVAVSLKRSASR